MKESWFYRANNIIANNLEAFYQHFLPEVRLEAVGANLRLEPCALCGHHGCATVTPGEPYFNCFSTGCYSGTILGYLQKVYPTDPELLFKVGEFIGVPYVPKEKSEEDITAERINTIKQVAADFYNQRLINTPEALEYQLRVRGHSLDLLNTFRIGFTGAFNELEATLKILNFTEEEIKGAKVWFPERLFVYPYIDPHSKKVLRFNTKNPLKVEYRGKIIEGFSTGMKSFMTTPQLMEEYVVLVEGENDLITSYDNGCQSIIAVGGMLSKVQIEILSRALEKFQAVYMCFDNDEAGREYEATISKIIPHKPLFRINYGDSVKDIDEAYRKGGLRVTFEELLRGAIEVESTGHKVSHDHLVWEIANRKQLLRFELMERGKSGELIGTIKYYENGELRDMAYDKPLTKFPKGKPLNYHLIQEMEEYFNEGIESKTVEQLVEIYWFSKWPNMVMKQLSLILFQTPEDDREKLIEFIKGRINPEITDMILKELNNLQNAAIEDYAAIPKMKLSQFFSPKNDECFFYFTYVRQDGDTTRKLPYLISNDRKLVRLDLYKRKDPQCILLIRNRYELPIEVPQALMELQYISLSQKWVEAWMNDEIDERELSPSLLIRRIESFTRRFYYFDEDDTYKVLALWIYGTYCYELFGQYPYLFLNGKKGSGKTILDTVLELIAFNPKMAVSISNAALFRSVSIEGGTHILDEMENMTDRKKNQDSDMAAVLKGGYSRSGKAIRCDKDNGNIPVGYDVFGPKVISNIFGIDDIISDRCLPIATLEAKKEFRSKLEDPKELFTEGLADVRELTSKCVLSMMVHFQRIYKVYRENIFHVENARLSQIMRPILALAHIAGSGYERALQNYYTKNIKVTKEENDYATPEGALEDILRDICMEVLGVNPYNYLSAVTHKYRNQVKFDRDEGWFELDALHVKTFMEEVMAGENVETKSVNTWIRRVSPVDMNNRKRRTTVPIEDESLMREYNGNTRVKVVVHRFYVSDFYNEEDITRLKAQAGPPEEEAEVGYEDF